ncbi:MAG: hypothetical protein WA814_10635 [Candidatus Baltobacteraceae bacterium]
MPSDTTSILKKLTKDVVIGSTIDPINGDTGPRALSTVPVNYELKKGQLLVCNFDDAAGAAGSGTTIEVIDRKPGSKPSRLLQSSKIEGCDGDAITTGDQVYATGLTSRTMTWIRQNGKIKKTYGSSIELPYADADGQPPFEYDPEYIFVGDAKSGSLFNLSLGLYGTGKLLHPVIGFAVKHPSPDGTLGPWPVVYSAAHSLKQILYVVDGANNTIVAISKPGNLLENDEIVVKPGGKTFSCKSPSATCARLVYSGPPLNGPVAPTVLPNGNLVVANSKGGNTLVELTPQGQILATKTIDKSKTAGIFGLLATGKDDSDTAIFFTDANSNNVQELEQ